MAKRRTSAAERLSDAEISEELRGRIARAIQGAHLTEYSAWSDLDVLSSNTELDGIEIDRELIRRSGDSFAGTLNVYVVLHYDKGEDAFQQADAFPGKFAVHLDGDTVKIDDITVDTSSFYE